MKKGFTFIELIFVIIILGILITVMVGQGAVEVTTSDREEAKQTLSNIKDRVLSKLNGNTDADTVIKLRAYIQKVEEKNKTLINTIEVTTLKHKMCVEELEILNNPTVKDEYSTIGEY